MGQLTISVAGLRFRAEWDADAPQTQTRIRRLLPLTARLIHVRWSGEATWIPMGVGVPDLGYENHTGHPSPGQLLYYPGGISEREILLPYGGCAFGSKVGPLAGNHFATIATDDGWLERLREVGRRCLWDGAQSIEIAEE